MSSPRHLGSNGDSGSPTASAPPPCYIVRACHWADGGTEVVYDDGTVLSFRNDMETFVAANGAAGSSSSLPYADASRLAFSSPGGGGMSAATGSSSVAPDMMFTSLCLSKYKAKVILALELYNRFSPMPRLVDGLLRGGKPAEAWTSSAPIDTMVLSNDPSLFAVSAQDGRATLSCAMRLVAMTLDRSGETFHVRWPSPVYDVEGSAYMFMTSSGAAGGQGASSPQPGTVGPNFLASSSFLLGMKAVRFVWLEQTFCVAEAPAPWRPMLDLLLSHLHAADAVLSGGDDSRSSLLHPYDRDPTSTTNSSREDRAEEDGDFTSGARSANHSTAALWATKGAHHQRHLQEAVLAPMLLPAGHRPATSTSTRRGPPPVAASPSFAGSRITFSPMQCGDAGLLVASTALHITASHLHGGAAAAVSWRFDATPTGRQPFVVYWSLAQQQQQPLLGESDAVVEGSGQAAGRVAAFVYEDASYVEAAPVGNAYAVLHCRTAAHRRAFHQSPDGSVALPRYVNASVVEPQQASSSSLADPEALARGRYLPEVGATLISISQANLKQASRAVGAAPPSSSSSMPAVSPHRSGFSSSPHAAAPSIASGSLAGAPPPRQSATEVVKCSTRIDHVGTFTALTNGVVRGHFDDRTILTLLPDAHDTDDGLAVTMVGRNATTTTMRAVHVTASHPMGPYLSYMMPFRRFQRLGAAEQKVLGNLGTRQQPMSSSGSGQGEQPRRSGSDALDPLAYQQRAVEEMEAVMFRTKLAIDKSQDLSNRSKALLTS